jgi:hypothetical protein
MKLTSAAETIIAEDSGASLHNHVTELEKDKNVLQRVVDLVIEDYNLVVTGNKKLASEHDKLKHRCEGLKAELSEARSDAIKELAILSLGLDLSKLVASTLLPTARNA